MERQRMTTMAGERIDLNRAEELTAAVSATVDDLFDYQRWNEDQTSRGRYVREALAQAVKVIISNVPPCPTRTRAINHLVDARMLANAAITHRGRY
jgi:hypothetical protein